MPLNSNGDCAKCKRAGREQNPDMCVDCGQGYCPHCDGGCSTSACAEEAPTEGIHRAGWEHALVTTPASSREEASTEGHAVTTSASASAKIELTNSAPSLSDHLEVEQARFALVEVVSGHAGLMAAAGCKELPQVIALIDALILAVHASRAQDVERLTKELDAVTSQCASAERELNALQLSKGGVFFLQRQNCGLAGEVKRLRAKLEAALKASTGWQPMKDAPLDGTPVILLLADDSVVRAEWVAIDSDLIGWRAAIEDQHPADWHGNFCYDDSEQPIGWMLAPPSLDEEAK